MEYFDVIVIGAGAAGLFCAAQAGARGRSVEVLDHAKKVGRKILMSGGGRCNFTNMYAEPANFLSQNPHFCKSALSRYTQWDFSDFHDMPLEEIGCVCSGACCPGPSQSLAILWNRIFLCCLLFSLLPGKGRFWFLLRFLR